MKLSIITAAKNNKAGLLRAIECVRNQTYKNVEHIIVDGGSTDGSVDILRSEQKEINKGSVIPANEVRQESTADSGLYPSLTRSRLKSDRNDTNSKKTEPLTSNLPTGQAGYQLPTSNYHLLSISEPDEGIYDAINKGIKLATGDVIGLLHSDDLFADENILKRYAEIFNSDSGRAGMTKKIEAVYSDLVYVRNKSKVKKPVPNLMRDQKSKVDSGQADSGSRQRRAGSSGMTDRSTTNYSLLTTNYSVIRYWKTHKTVSSNQSSVNRKNTDHHLLVTNHLLKKGWMPPHPTLFIRKEVFERYGLYNKDLKIASDYEMILRLLFKYKITSYYLPVTTYLMTIGGASNKNLKNILQKSKEDYRAMKMNGINFPVFTLISKNLRKLPQFLVRD